MRIVFTGRWRRWRPLRRRRRRRSIRKQDAGRRLFGPVSFFLYKYRDLFIIIIAISIHVGIFVYFFSIFGGSSWIFFLKDPIKFHKDFQQLVHII